MTMLESVPVALFLIMVVVSVLAILFVILKLFSAVIGSLTVKK